MCFPFDSTSVSSFLLFFSWVISLSMVSFFFTSLLSSPSWSYISTLWLNSSRPSMSLFEISSLCIEQFSISSFDPVCNIGFLSSVSSTFFSLSADASSTFSKASRGIFAVHLGRGFLPINGLNFHDPWTYNITHILAYMFHNIILDYGILMCFLPQMWIEKYHILAYAPCSNVRHTLHCNAILYRI